MKLIAPLAFLLVFSPLLAAQSKESIVYTVRFPAPQTHYLEVEAVVPAAKPGTEFMMAVWTPGSYLVREYSSISSLHSIPGNPGRSRSGRMRQMSSSI